MPALAGVEHRWIDAGGLRMHVAEAGDGPPLVLLHGWPQHWWAWREVIPALARDFRVLAVDLRGAGWTDAPPDGYEKEQLATDVLAALDALGLDRVSVVGHDWGGVAGFMLCLRAPERIDRYVALNTGHVWVSANARTARDLWRFAYQPLVASPVLGQRVMHQIARTAHRLGTARRGAIAPADVEILTAQFREPDRARAAVQLYRTFLLREAPAIARGRYAGQRLTTPTLWLHGVRDMVARPYLASSLEPHADDVTIELVEDSGHFIAEEQPALVASKVREFVKPPQS